MLTTLNVPSRHAAVQADRHDADHARDFQRGVGYAAPAPVVEHIFAALSVRTAPPVVECISPARAVNYVSCMHDGQPRSPPRAVHGVLSHVPISCDAEVSQLTLETYNVPTRHVAIKAEIDDANNF